MAQWVFLAVSSIPFWSVWVRPWAFGIPFIIFHTVIIAGGLFSGGSSVSQGPLNSFSFSTVHIMSLLEVISIISVVGQVACRFLRFCILFLISSCCAVATFVLYLLIASLADVILIDVRPVLGVFLFFFVHRWQNQSCDGK